MGKNYIRHSEESYSSGTQRLLTRVSPGFDYRARDLEEQLTSRMRSNYPVGHDPWYGSLGSMSSPYGHPGPVADLSYRMNTSAMQR
jgi:hypothetical protein